MYLLYVCTYVQNTLCQQYANIVFKLNLKLISINKIPTFYNICIK